MELLKAYEKIEDSPKSMVYFADAAYPQHNTKSAYVWIAKGKDKEIPSVSGRQ